MAHLFARRHTENTLAGPPVMHSVLVRTKGWIIAHDRYDRPGRCES